MRSGKLTVEKISSETNSSDRGPDDREIRNLDEAREMLPSVNLREEISCNEVQIRARIATSCALAEVEGD